MLTQRPVIRRFCQNSSGNVAIITALAALPMLGLMGLCIDYGIGISNKSKLDAAADAAAVAAITSTQSALMAKDPDAIATGKARGLAVFAANVGKINFGGSTPPVPSIDLSLSPDGTSVQANVAYTTSNTSQFGKLFGVQNTKLSGTTAAALSLTQYIQIYLVVDISQSMGIGATQSDIDKMFPKLGCAFACHLQESPPSPSFETTAHGIPNVNLRIDVVKAAASTMINQASKSTVNAAKTKIGLYTFESNLTPVIDPPSTDYNGLTTAVSNIDLGSSYMPGQPDSNTTRHADTYSQACLSTGSVSSSGQPTKSLTKIVGMSGDGYTEGNPKKYVFIMTDGTSDTIDQTAQQQITPYDPSWMQAMKTNGVTVGIVYTTYFQLYQNNDPSQGIEPNYYTWIYPINKNPVASPTTPINSKIRDGMLSSASSASWFFEASKGSDIAAALNKLLTQAQSPARLTN